MPENPYTHPKTVLRKGFLRSFVRLCVLGTALLWALAVLILVAARWIDPSITAVHIERRTQIRPNRGTPQIVVITSVMPTELENRRPPDATQEATDHDLSPELEGSLRTPWKWEQLIVEAAVIGGRDRWVRRLTGLENQLRLEHEACTKDDPGSPRLQGLARSLRNLHHLRAFALPIIEELAELPGTASWGEWIARLEVIVPKTLRHPERVLGVLADMKPMAPIQSVSLQEVRTVLHMWLANVQKEPPAYRY